MPTLDLTAEEVSKYKEACARDEMVERSPVAWISREAYYACHDIIRGRRLSGTPQKVTVTFIDHAGQKLYELHYSAA